MVKGFCKVLFLELNNYDFEICDCCVYVIIEKKLDKM